MMIWGVNHGYEDDILKVVAVTSLLMLVLGLPFTCHGGIHMFNVFNESVNIDGDTYWWTMMKIDEFSCHAHVQFCHDLVNTFDFFFICCYELWFEWSLKWGCQKLGSPNAAEEVYYNSRRPHGTFYFLHSWRFSWCPGFMVLIGISYHFWFRNVSWFNLEGIWWKKKFRFIKAKG